MINHDANPSRPGVNRVRAPQACLHCRKRKVRCDVVSKGLPCTNCTLDRRLCEVARRQQRRHLDAPVTRQPADTDWPSQADTHQLSVSQPDRASRTDSFYDTLITEEIFNQIQSNKDELRSHYFMKTGQNSAPAVSSRNASISSTNTHNSTFLSAANDTMRKGPAFTSWTEYPFLKADIDPNLPESDLNFLHQRGCLSVPVRWILNELVREYFLHVHPYLPIVNEAEFWASYRNLRGGQISLMLFQAMLFAASGFISRSCIKHLDFKTVHEMRANFYGRVKTLYDLEIDRDIVTSAQTGLLLTYYVSTKNANINSQWLTIAIHHARLVQAHRYYEFKHGLRNLLKRIWWACICRDRLLSLGVRRPLQIQSHDFDFSQPVLSLGDFSDEIHRSLVYSADSKRALIQLLTAQCELAVALTDGLSYISPLNKPISTDHERLKNIINELEKWQTGSREKLDLLTDLGIGHDSIVLYRNILSIYYQSAQLALNNHAIYLSINYSKQNEGNQNHESQAWLEYPVSDSIREITECLLELSQRELLQYLPITLVANIALPLTWCMIGSQISYMEAEKNIENDAFTIYRGVIDGLLVQYEGTDRVLDYIRKIIHSLHLEDPRDNEIVKGIRRRRETSQFAHARYFEKQARHEDSIVEIYSLARCDLVDYVRITRTIDLSLAIGHFPESREMPISLQILASNIYSPLCCPFSSPSSTEISPAAPVTIPPRNRYSELETSTIDMSTGFNAQYAPTDQQQHNLLNSTAVEGTTSDSHSDMEIYDMPSSNLMAMSLTSLPDIAPNGSESMGPDDLFMNVFSYN